MNLGKEACHSSDLAKSLSTVVFDANVIEITSGKPAVPIPCSIPKRREQPETPSPIPDRRPLPIEVPVTPTSPIKEPALPAKIPVPSR